MMKKKSISEQIIYSIAFAVLVYLMLSIWGASGDLIKAFSQFDWQKIALVLSLALANYLTRFIKWQYYLRILKINIPRKESFMIHMSGLAMSITPGKLGEVVKSYFLKKGYNKSFSETAPIVLADRLTDLMSLIILCVIGAYGFSYGQNIVWGVSYGIIGISLIFMFRPLGQRIINLVSSTKILIKKKDKIQKLYDSACVLLRPKRIILPLLISIIAWGFEALAFFLVLRGFGLSQDYLSAFFIYSFSTIVGAISMLPGGLGVTDGAIAGLLKILNINNGVATLATIIIRAATLWFAVVIGLIFLVYTERKFNVKINEINSDIKN